MDDVRQKLLRVEQAIQRQYPHRADLYSRAAVSVAGVEVMKISYRDPDRGEGLSLFIRVHGIAPYVDNAGGETGESLDLPVCFRLYYGTDVNDDAVDEVTCPATKPLVISTEPELPRDIDQTLRTKLPTGPDATEATVRAAVGAIDLEPQVRRDVHSATGAIGVALRASQYDCVLARVIGDKIEVWRPSRVQLAPGELTCTAATAAAGYGQRPPH